MLKLTVSMDQQRQQDQGERAPGCTCPADLFAEGEECQEGELYRADYVAAGSVS